MNSGFTTSTSRFKEVCISALQNYTRLNTKSLHHPASRPLVVPRLRPILLIVFFPPCLHKAPHVPRLALTPHPPRPAALGEAARVSSHYPRASHQPELRRRAEPDRKSPRSAERTSTSATESHQPSSSPAFLDEGLEKSSPPAARQGSGRTAAP